MLQVAKRRHATAEIVQGKAAAEGLQVVDEACRPRKARDRRRFGDLEADRAVRNAERLELRTDEAKEIVVAQRCPRQVDGPSMRVNRSFPRDDAREFLETGRDD